LVEIIIGRINPNYLSMSVKRLTNLILCEVLTEDLHMLEATKDLH